MRPLLPRRRRVSDAIAPLDQYPNTMTAESMAASIARRVNEVGVDVETAAIRVIEGYIRWADQPEDEPSA